MIRTASSFALLLLLLAPPGAEALEPGELAVSRSRIRFRAPGEGRDSLKLDLRFILGRSLDLEQDELTVEIGPVTHTHHPPPHPPLFNPFSFLLHVCTSLPGVTPDKAACQWLQ